MSECDEIVIAMDIASTKKTNTITTNVTSSASINCHGKKLRVCYVSRTVLLITFTLLIAACIFCYLIKYWTKNLLPFQK